jgi:hypothetical protein
MYRKYVALLAVMASLILGVSAATAQKQYAFPIGLNVVCPTKNIAPNIVYGGCNIVVKNNTSRSVGRLKVNFTPADVVLKSRMRFKKVHLQGFAPAATASWVIANVGAGAVRKVPVTLKFPVPPQSRKPKFSIFLAGDQLGGGAFGHNYVTLHYKGGGG